MSRQARKLSQTGLYHICFIGICKQNIFEEASDYARLKAIIKQAKQEMQFELYAYCFMTNHVHLFLKEKNIGEISKIMSKILSAYATWYNIKYSRSGTLFSNRYKSEPVEDERYFFNLIRYIHQNPLKANLVKDLQEYPYSSYHEYAKNTSGITDTDFLFDMLDDNRKQAIEQFIELTQSEEKEDFEIFDSRKKSEASIRRMIMGEIDGNEPATIKKMNKDLRNELIKRLVNEKGISKSALERAIGLSRETITKICDERKYKKAVPQALPTFFD